MVLGDGQGCCGIEVGGDGVDLLETNTEAKVLCGRSGRCSCAWRNASPTRRVQEPPRGLRAEPEAAPGGSITGLPVGSSVPVRGPLPNVSVHIEKAPRVGRVLATSAVWPILLIIVRIGRGDGVAP